MEGQTLAVGSHGGHTHGRALSSLSSCYDSILSCNNQKCLCVHAKSFQSRLTLYDPVDCSLPGSSIHGILQAKLLEWVAVPFTRGIFLTQGSNPSLLHRRRIVYPLSHQGNPRHYQISSVCVRVCVCVCMKLPSFASHHQKKHHLCPVFLEQHFFFVSLLWIMIGIKETFCMSFTTTMP